MTSKKTSTNPTRAEKSEPLTHSSRGIKTQESLAVPDASSPEFAFLVATYAWYDGLTANAISKQLFHDSSPRHLMQVKRALKRAHNSDVLRLVAPKSQRVHDKLHAQLNENHPGPELKFHVVEDSRRSVGASVYAKAAELVSRFILEAARRNQALHEPSEVVICNAGGRVVSETVRALFRNPPVLGDTDDEVQRLRKSLIFVAGNAAYEPQEFERSANFLSVKMAELFDAPHFALPREEDPEHAKTHADFVERAALFICGAGNFHEEQVSGLMAHYAKRYGWKLTGHVVGDIALNLLDPRGGDIELPEEARKIMRIVNPSVNLARLMHIANSGRVLLILDAKDPHTKRKIGAAILRRRYVTDVVVGTRLALEILDEWRSVT